MGRERALARLGAAFAAGARLVTVLGPAGMGKTRLARRYAAIRREAGGRVWFCDLSEARRAEELVGAVASALGIPPAGAAAADVAERIGDALCGRGPVLLILDNFEQIVAHAVGSVGRWLADAPDASFLVTSREPLALEGERREELEPLRDDEGMALFEARGRAVRPGFAPEGKDRAAMRALVRALDGMPLAIELAAARLGVLSPAGLRERLGRRLDLLKGRRRDVSRRHLTLRNAIDWSWEMLSGWERAALVQCAVFRGGFSLEAAEAVIDLAEEAPSPVAMDAVQALRDRSLVWSRDGPDGDSVRFGLYESIRDYALEKLDAAGLRAAAEARHAAFYLRAGTDWAAAARGPEGARWLARLALERENLMAVAQRCAATGDLRGAARAVLSLELMLRIRGPLDLHRALLEDAARAADGTGDPALRSEVLRARGNAARMGGDAAAAESDLAEARSLASAAGSRALDAEALGALGVLRFQQRRLAEARACYQEALVLQRALGDHRSVGLNLANLANALLEEGRLEEARAHAGEALATLAAASNEYFTSVALTTLGIVAQELGDLDDAERHYGQALQAMGVLGDRRGEAIVIGNLGELRLARGQDEEARGWLDESVAIFREVGARVLEGAMLCELGTAWLAAGRLEEARACWRSSLECVRGLSPFREGLALAWLGAGAAAAGRLDEAGEAFAAARALLAGSGRYASLAVLDVLEGFADIARGAAPRAHARLARRPEDGADPARSSALRLARRLLDQALARAAPPAAGATALDGPRFDGLEVGPQARWFRLPAGARVDIARRPVVRRLLAALVTRRSGAPGAPLSPGDLLAAGWPEERIAHGATNRLYVAIASLRALGLAEILVTRRGGYLLDPKVPLRVSEP